MTYDDPTVPLLRIAIDLAAACNARDREAVRRLEGPFKLAMAEFKLHANATPEKDYRHVAIAGQEIEDAINRILRPAPGGSGQTQGRAV